MWRVTPSCWRGRRGGSDSGEVTYCYSTCEKEHLVFGMCAGRVRQKKRFTRSLADSEGREGEAELLQMVRNTEQIATYIADCFCSHR